MTKELKYSLLIIFAAMVAITLIVPLGASLYNIFQNQQVSNMLAASGIRLLLVIALLYIIKKKGFLQFNGLSPSFSVSNLFILYISVAIILFTAYSSYEIYLEAKPEKLFLFGITQALVGVFEELLFRGIVLPLLILHYAGKPRPIFKAVCLSSVLFGLVHFAQLIRHPENLFNTIITVIFAIGIGFVFACILLRTRNIIVPAFLHFLVDFANGTSDLKEEVLANTIPTQSTIILTLIVIIALALIFIGVGMFLFKRVQKEEWLHKVSFIKI
jgi:membrane protease YdiL (CAAX protease family)